MTALLVAIALLALLLVVALVALAVPQRPASEHRNTPHSTLDAETEAHEHHTPGGNTGGL